MVVYSQNMCPFSDKCRRYVGKVFHTRGPAAEKLLSQKQFCVRAYTFRHGPKPRATSVKVVPWCLRTVEAGADLWFLWRQFVNDVSHVHTCTPGSGYLYSLPDPRLPSQLHSITASTLHHPAAAHPCTVGWYSLHLPWKDVTWHTVFVTTVPS